MQRAVVYPSRVKKIDASAEDSELFLILGGDVMQGCLFLLCILHLFKVSWKTLLKQAGNATEEVVSSGVKS